ncbi:MAG: hypothetical protein KJZ87_27750 [Thermoguttaceae bacterium]|nr:hypothetical protein [Thermoguttaceae bacterium]
MLLPVTLLLALSAGAAVADETAGLWSRVKQVGHLPGDLKIAVLSSDRPLSGAFSVGDFRGNIGPDLGVWRPFWAQLPARLHRIRHTRPLPSALWRR